MGLLMKALRIVRKIIQKLFSRLFVVALGIMIQLVWLYMVLYQFSIQHTFANLFVIVLGVVTAVYVVSRPGNPAAKLAWTFLLLIVPLLGIVIYFVFGFILISYLNLPIMAVTICGLVVAFIVTYEKGMIKPQMTQASGNDDGEEDLFDA